MKIYNREEYRMQVAKDTMKLSEHFANLSKALEKNDVPQMKKYFKRIARLMNLNRCWDRFPQNLMKYMDVDLYRRLGI